MGWVISRSSPAQITLNPRIEPRSSILIPNPFLSSAPPPKISLHPISCIPSSGGHRVCAKLKQRLMLCRNLRVTSSLMMCAWPLSLSWSFSRADRSWMPTMVTPMGHALLGGEGERGEKLVGVGMLIGGRGREGELTLFQC